MPTPDGGELGVFSIGILFEAEPLESTWSIAGEVHTGNWVGCKVGAESGSMPFITGADKSGIAVRVGISCLTDSGMFEQPAKNNNKKMARYCQDNRKHRLNIICWPKADWIDFYRAKNARFISSSEYSSRIASSQVRSCRFSKCQYLIPWKKVRQFSWAGTRTHP
jgi:hypothetical protein